MYTVKEIGLTKADLKEIFLHYIPYRRYKNLSMLQDIRRYDYMCIILESADT